MPPGQYLPTHELYAEQLLPLNLGFALYEPDPGPRKEEVRIGDIGYIYDGRFKRIASVFESGNGMPLALEERFHDTEPFADLDKGVLSSKSVRSEGIEGSLSGSEPMSGTSAGIGLKFSCQSERGATLIRKYSATVEKTSYPIKLKQHFGKHFRSVFDSAKANGVVENLHDIILVYGRVMTGDWATLAFSNHSEDNSASFDIKAATVTAKGTLWGKWSDDVTFPRRHGPPRQQSDVRGVPPFDQCVFIETCRFYDLPWFHRLLASVRIPQNKGPTGSAHEDGGKIGNLPVSARMSNFTSSGSDGRSEIDIGSSQLSAYDALAFQAFYVALGVASESERLLKETDVSLDCICIDEDDMKRLLPSSGTIGSIVNDLNRFPTERFNVTTASDVDGWNKVGRLTIHSQFQGDFIDEEAITPSNMGRGQQATHAPEPSTTGPRFNNLPNAVSYPSYGTPVDRKSSYPMFPTPSTEASAPPAYLNGYFTSGPPSYSLDGYHNSRSPPKIATEYVGGFYAPQHNTNHQSSCGIEKGYSYPAPPRSNPPSYGSQQGYQFNSTRSAYLAAHGALPPNYSNPPSYPPSSAPSLTSTSSRSESCTLDVRPGDLRYTFIKVGIVEMTTCKEIFASWAEELDQCKNIRTPLEQSLIDCVYELRDESASVLESSHSVLDSYRSFARCMDRNLRKLSQEGGQLHASSDLQKLGSEIITQSEALSTHVLTMQEKLVDLVNMLDLTKRDASKHKLWKKVWGWLVKAFKILAAVLTASAVIAPFVHPIGVGASVVMGGLTTLTSSAAAICEEFRKHASQELIFDNIVDLLRYKVPESAKKAELALSTFQTCQHVLRVGIEVQNGHNGWVDAAEASEAANEWAHASDELHKFVEVPTRASLI